MPGADRPTHRRIASPLVGGMLYLAAIALFAPAVHAQTPQNPAEQYVLDQLSLHGYADLRRAGLKDRTISHQFLEDLITNPTPPGAVRTHGIWITGAAIDGELVVSNATIAFPVTFDHCTFKSGFDLSSNIFNRNFLLTESSVGSPPSKQEAREATFKGDRFDGEVSIDKTTFLNGVDFSDVDIGGALESHDTRYESADNEADFSDIQVRLETSFRGAVFKGGLDLTGADLAQLSIDGSSSTGAPSQGSPAVNLVLNHAHVKKGLTVRNLELSGFGAVSAVIQSGASVANVILSGPVFLSDSRFASLSLSGFPLWKAQAEKSQFDGFSFDSISTDSTRTPNAMGVLELLNRSPFNPQPYLALEKYLRSSGHPDSADEVYFDMRARGRAQLDPFDESLDWLQYVLVGYGRQTWKAALYALLIIVAGAFIFTPNRMDPDDKHSTDLWYNSLWFSLDLLSPIDLGVAKKWRAKHHLLRHYSQIHRVAGWILIPLIAAAITGIIK